LIKRGVICTEAFIFPQYFIERLYPFYCGIDHSVFHGDAGLPSVDKDTCGVGCAAEVAGSGSEKTKVAEERREKMERLLDQVIVTLAKIIDAKDKYTNGHSERVAKYSREIARRMGLSEQKQEEIYFMGILHDIGKIGIPDTIINKTEKLTDEEYQMIKRHPEIGEEILKNITEIPNISLGAKYHHEKYDGGGYPNRAAGEEIPLEARIIGIADAYDAMASTRSYRDVLPQKVVRAEIEKGRGTQFDPECTDILLKMMEEDKDYRMRE